ncbi:protein kinase [Nocardiopsis sediminis]|uniref:non-specific serine/threonine protein kinase n=1 Tax=Nocardiopsis sediminis TaxID=1778267 RepID=A0ABV8FL59_9ACTN
MQGMVLAERYRLDAPLGSGGTGRVWRAHDTRLSRTVAVKLLRRSTGSGKMSEARFGRAAVINAQLSGHAHIVPVHDHGRHLTPWGESVPYTVMEFLTGPALADLIAEQPVLPVPRMVEWGAQICDALAAIHAEGVVHRDIKPGNVLLTHPYADLGKVKVTDFDVAARSDDGSPVTSSGLLIGTPAYMAPEQARSGASVDGRSDLYSLGCLLYALLTGRPPFSSGDDTALLSAHAGALPEPPSVRNPRTPRALEQLILELLAKDPADRPPHAHAVHDRLRALHHELQEPPRRLTPDEVRRMEERAYDLVERGEHGAAAHVLEHVLREYLRDPGPEHHRTLLVRHVYAYNLAAAGRHVPAAHAQEQLAFDRARVLGPDHPDTLSARHHHAFNLGEAGERERAARLLERVAEDRARVLGPDRPETLSARHNHAFNLGEAGERERAARLLERVAEDRARVLGPDHPDTLLSRHDHACELGEAGDRAEAARLLETLAEDAVRLLGTDHPRTLAAQGALARFL